MRVPHLIAAVLALVAATEPAAAGWRPPVGGEVVRPFDLGADPFEAGRHRGADLAAAPGAAVRAPCAGPVVVAGRVGTSGRVVTLRCGRWRVSHMPFATLAVRAGQVVGRGDRLGTVASSREHAGLHLGVRREGDRFGYADPQRFLETRREAPPPLTSPRRPPSAPRPARPPGRAPRPRLVRPAPRAAPARPLGAAPRPALPADAEPRADPAPRPLGSNPVPWPAWGGLSLVLAGLGLGWRARARPRRRAVRAGAVRLRT
jgi:murein DD-endopeptidase MepM/ murein hydrolase activator NlpD